MNIHIVLDRKPENHLVVSAICEQRIVVDQVIAASWEDGRICRKCYVKRDSEAYRVAKLIFAVTGSQIQFNKSQ